MAIKVKGRGWLKCPKCKKKTAYVMTDSCNLWCVECKTIANEKV